jgi:hypothetical protein
MSREDDVKDLEKMQRGEEREVRLGYTLLIETSSDESARRGVASRD